jgi:hypothetical protein
VATLIANGFPVWPAISHESLDYPPYTDRPRASQVSFVNEPRAIPGSDNKTLDEQLLEVAEYSKYLNLKGVRAILPGFGDIVALVAEHFKQTGKRLFGEEDGLIYVRTATHAYGPISVPEVRGFFSEVGRFEERAGLYVGASHKSFRSAGLYAFALLVPDIDHEANRET